VDKTFLKKLQNLDRRIIFAVTALAVIIPILFPIGFPVAPTEPVKKIFNAIENLKEGSTILLSCDYDPPSAAEVQPMAKAILIHCFRKKIKVVTLALWPQGAQQFEMALTDATNFCLKNGILKEPPKKEIDYVNLGYKAGGAIVIKAVGANFRKAIQSVDNKSLDEVPILKNIKSIKDFAMVVTLSSGDPGLKQWVMIVQAQYQVAVAGGCTAVSAPEFYPYLQSGQLLGLMGGMAGAAEYEVLLKYKGNGVGGMDAQSIVHIVIIVFIIIANITYFMLEKAKKKGGI